ncbi:alpha-L-fucosidase [Coraliomargarita algicola]|uniref:alpha-L-fucosidase n=1 Tax=Coraliomargarita algicola TaxID=3092156 RepID=A0ABZ0RMA2_9BACT|nr:alpha-L-fucosidase [Coraliomargarita sp. J2-16]WPJ97346.1 alpha-L-fucosidase [Coraliomargarita sp. J2-16]
MSLSSTKPHPYGAIPSPRQLQWQSTELMSIVHFSLSTFADKEWGYGEDPASLFNPSALDAGQWVRVAKDAGIQGMILVCKHHDGFCLWPTKTTEYCVRNSPWKEGQGDVVAEVSAACREYGLKFGVYLSPWDRNHAQYGRPEYVAVYHQQLTELLTQYGPLYEVWFDGANGGDGYYGGTNERRSIDSESYYQWDQIKALVRKHQPEACMFGLEDIRYVGNESGVAGETCWATQTFIGHPSAQQSESPSTLGDRHGEWMPAECDFPLRKGWFFHANDWIRQPEKLFDIYCTSVGRGGAMNIGLAPDTRGLLHDDDIVALQGWKALMDQTFGVDLLQSNVTGVSANNVRAGDSQYAASCVLDGEAGTYWACDDDLPHPELVFELDTPITFNLLSIGEFLPLGQRVDAFSVDIWTEGQWQEVGTATSIGNRRLLILKNAQAQKFRIRFTDCAACPAIRAVALYRAPIGLILRGQLSIVRNREGRVTIRSSNSGLTVRYTLDGSEPNRSSLLYTGPFPFTQSGTIKAFGYIENVEGAQIASVSSTFGMDRRGWSVVDVSLDSPFTNDGIAGVEKLLDDDPETYWHTYHADKKKSAPPHDVTLDMGQAVPVKAFTFQPHLTTGIPCAIPDKYEFHLSLDGESWTLAAEGEFGNIKANPEMQLVPLMQPVVARYLRFVALHVIDEGNYVIVAGLGVVEA